MALIPALAGADPPGSEAAHIASEPALQALLGGLVIVRLQDGEELQGVLLSFDAQVLTLQGTSDQPLSVTRAEVTQLRLVSPPPASGTALRNAQGKRIWIRLRHGEEQSGQLLEFTPDTLLLVDSDAVVHSVSRAQVEAFRREADRRQIGVSLGLLPGLMIDADIGIFRSYISGSIVFPAALDGKLWGVSTGVGVALPVWPAVPEFRLDVLTHLNLMAVESACEACGYPTAYVFGFGLAVGIHTTLDTGFTIGMTVPVIGYSVTPNYKGSGNAAVGHYFLSSAVSMPLGFVGYRF